MWASRPRCSARLFWRVTTSRTGSRSNLPRAIRRESPGNIDHNRTITFNTVNIEESQTEAKPLGLYADRHVDQIWKLHVAGNTLFAGVSEAGLFRSDDRGKSWQPVLALNNHETQPSWGPGFGGLCLHSLLSDARDPQRLWIAISAAGVFRSDDGGNSWARKVDGVPPGADDAWCVHGLAHDPDNADRILAQFHDGMFRSADGGDHWERIEQGLPPADMSSGAKSAFGFAIEVDPHTGYSVIRAESLDDAENIAQGCPIIASTRVYEIMGGK